MVLATLCGLTILHNLTWPEFSALSGQARFIFFIILTSLLLSALRYFMTLIPPKPIIMPFYLQAISNERQRTTNSTTSPDKRPSSSEGRSWNYDNSREVTGAPKLALPPSPSTGTSSNIHGTRDKTDAKSTCGSMKSPDKWHIEEV
jgi:hypothetical protein